MRRRLRSAERFNDNAITCGLFLKTPLSSVIASLLSVTVFDQRRAVFLPLARAPALAVFFFVRRAVIGKLRSAACAC